MFEFCFLFVLVLLFDGRIPTRFTTGQLTSDSSQLVSSGQTADKQAADVISLACSVQEMTGKGGRGGGEAIHSRESERERERHRWTLICVAAAGAGSGRGVRLVRAADMVLGCIMWGMHGAKGRYGGDSTEHSHGLG